MTNDEADVWDRQQVEVDGHPSTGFFGIFGDNRKRNQRIARTVKFVHLPSTHVYLEHANQVQSWAYKGNTITYETRSNFIPVDSTAMIATSGIATSEAAIILAALFGFQDSFDEESDSSGTDEQHARIPMTVKKYFGDVFAITCSLIELAKHICEPVLMIGSPYEFVYDLNGRGLITHAQFETIRARNTEDEQADRDRLHRDRLASEHIASVKEQNTKIDRLRDDQTALAWRHA